MIFAGVMALFAGAAFAQTKPPDRNADEKALIGEHAMREAIRQLTEEATIVKKQLRIESEEADFADRFEHEVEDRDVIDAILKRSHRDTFIDAYIRWQLTSFDVELPEMSDGAFADFMDQTPAMVENPKADERTITQFEGAESRGPMIDKVIARIRAAELTLDEKTRIAEHMNRPAVEFRKWVGKQLGDKGLRPRQWMMEKLRALARAGWSISGQKGRLTREFTLSVDDETFEPRQRVLLIRQLSTLIGFERKYLGEITYLASGRIDVTLRSVAIDQDDVDRWADRLMGRIM